MEQTAVPVGTTNSAENIEFDLQQYFGRIGYSGAIEATLETLSEIHRLHAQAIPFENLNPFLRVPVDLDLRALFSKLILNNRGGYCFEHNLMLMHVLKSLGFDVKGLAARVLWNSPEGKVVPRGHMLLLITLGDQRYIADVGFGGLTLTAPLRLETDVEQQTPHEAFKLTMMGDDYLLLGRVQGMWKRVYSFGLQENFLPDYEVTSWYLSNYPSSHFITGLIAARPFEGGRYVLRNNDFGTHFLNGSHERKFIDNVRDLKDVLVNIFKISLPNVPQLDDYLSRVVQPPKK